MNPLNNYPKVRSWLYLIQWVLNGLSVVLGALFAFMYGDPSEFPKWFLGALAVLPVLWTYLGLTAQANTPVAEVNPEPKDAVVHDPEDPVEDGDVPLPLANQDESLLYGDGTERGSEGSF